MTNLIRYLPEYYQESRQMNAIMDAAAPDIPDVDNELWKALFLIDAPEKWLYLWQKELNEEKREALVAKLRSSGTLNQETLQALGLSALETFTLSPEDGYMLSGDDSVLPDGTFYGPLISAIYVPPDNLKVVKNLLAISGLAGFKYWIAVQIQEAARQSTGRTGTLRNLYPGITFVSQPAYDELSGIKIQTTSQFSFQYFNYAQEQRSWWSPNVHFLENLTYCTQPLVTQQAVITVSKEE